MKQVVKLPSRAALSSPPPAHRLSHAIAKAPPPRKIRVIHDLAPEIIKTEARHFRELVQRLTGKPPQKGSRASAAPTGGDASPSPSPPTSVSSYDTVGDEGLGGAGAGAAAGIEVKVKEEADTSSPSGGDEGGGFLRALELDGYAADFYLGLEDFLVSSCDMDGF